MEPNPQMIRMIWVSPRFPLGTPDGARLATCSLVRQLTRRGVHIGLVCLVPDGELANPEQAQSDLGVQTCSIIRRSRSKFFPIPGWKTPFTFRTFAATAVRRAFDRELQGFLKTGRPGEKTYVVFDGLHTFAAFPGQLRDLSARVTGVIYRAHNFETVLWDQCVERARMPWLRLFFSYQAALVRRFEQRICREVQMIAPVSDDDAKRFERIAPATRVSVVRIGMDFPEPQTLHPAADSNRLELLFLGRLDWLPNRSGLKWFLETVWPDVIVARPQIVLKIAGAGDGRWLQPYQQLPGIEVLGRVESVDPLYRSCALCIAPLFQGSGTRVKIIESSRFLRGVVTTALGAEGSGLVPGVSYFRAETAQEWVTLLKTVTVEDCRRVGLEAYGTMRERFDEQTIAGHLLKSLDFSRTSL